MKRIFSTASHILLLAVLLASITGCGAAAPVPSQPTLDPTQVMEDARATVVAEITEDARLHPSATPTATQTPLPTSTPLPSATPTVTLTATPSITDTPAPTFTPTALPLSSKFLYAVTYPENKNRYPSNEKFGLALGFLNTGSIDWNSSYTIRLTGFEGEVTVQTEATLGRSVKPGEKGEWNLWAYGSEMMGKHVFYFQIYTDTGAAIDGGFGYFTYEAY